MKIPPSWSNNLDKPQFLAFLLLFPAGFVVLGVLLIPLLVSLGLSFTDLNLVRPGSGQWIGLENYGLALQDPQFWKTLGRTLYFALMTVSIETSLGVAMALLLNKNFRGRGLVRGLVILPWALPYVVNGLMWKWIFDANYGAFNALLLQNHWISQYQIWLGDPATAMNLVIVANVWKETPVAVILVLAALQSIPKDLYEAAAIDGAKARQAFWYVTLPLLRPVIAALVVIKTIWALKEFDLIYIITKGGPADSTNVFSYYIYQKTFQFLKFGEGSALAYLLTFLAIVLSLLYLKSLKEELHVES